MRGRCFLFVVDFEVRHASGELSGGAEREDECAHVVHAVLSAFAVVDLLDVEGLDEFAVDEEACLAVVTLDGDAALAALGNGVGELVEVAVAGESQHAAHGVGQVEDSRLRAEELGAGALCRAVEVEFHAVAVAHFLVGQGLSGLDVGQFIGQSFALADAAALVDAGGFAQGEAFLVELVEGDGCLSVAVPRLGGDDLHAGEGAVVDVLGRDAVAHVVVPDGEHAAHEGRVAFVELDIADDGGRPLVVEHLQVQVVVVVAGGGHDVDEAVGDADELVALLGHFLGLCVAVIPAVHDNVLGLDGRLAFGVGECAPDHGLLAVALDFADVVVGEGAELFDNGGVGVRILVRADMHARTDEHGVVAAEVFVEHAVDEVVGGW